MSVYIFVFCYCTLLPANSTPLIYPVGLTDFNIQYNTLENHLYSGCGNSALKCPTTLFVFLPGTGMGPSQYQKILVEMAKTGLPVIGLNYQNNGSLYEKWCGENDLCYYQVRHDRLYGSDRSDYVRSTADGVQNRLLKLLKALHWDNFYSKDSQIRYDRIIFGGHSQGAGLAAFIGKEKNVVKICQFSGTWDYIASTETPASWTMSNGKTDANRYYGFTHQNDIYPNGIDTVDRVWSGLGMGSATPVSWNVQDFSKLKKQGNLVKKLKTEDLDCKGKEHGCTVYDDATPMNGTTPRYAAVWRYLCGK